MTSCTSIASMHLYFDFSNTGGPSDRFHALKSWETSAAINCSTSERGLFVLQTLLQDQDPRLHHIVCIVEISQIRFQPICCGVDVVDRASMSITVHTWSLGLAGSTTCSKADSEPSSTRGSCRGI
jgi:hypothetical protein